MRQIRMNVFETNSSSTHSIAICTEEDFKKWQNGELLFNINNEKFVKNNYTITDKDRQDAKEQYERFKSKYAKDFDELSKELQEEYISGYVSDRRMYDDGDEYCGALLNYKEYKDHYSDLEFDTTHYTSPSGDKLVITCAYGYD